VAGGWAAVDAGRCCCGATFGRAGATVGREGALRAGAAAPRRERGIFDEEVRGFDGW
jgi:hypothetical protein